MGTGMGLYWIVDTGVVLTWALASYLGGHWYGTLVETGMVLQWELASFWALA